MQQLDIEVPAAGQLCRLAEDLYWARFELPFRLNHINLYIIDTGEGLCLIDAGVNTAKTAQCWQALFDGPLAGKQISRLIVTHHHVDHIGYAGELARRFGLKMEMTEAEAEHARWLYALTDAEYGKVSAEHYRAFGLEDEHIQATATGGSRYRRMSAPFSDIAYLSAGETITTPAGNWVIRIDRGHSDAHISLMDTARQLYIGVDFLLPRISPNISADIRDRDDDLLSAYLIYLEEMQLLDDKVKVFPGHDWPFAHAGRRARQLIAHHQDRLALLIEAARTAPLSTSDAINFLFGRRFSDHELYFASGEARAHLNYLVAQNMMVQEQTEGQADLFYLKDTQRD